MPKSSAVQLESPEAIEAVDSIFAIAGLEHGRRASRKGTWAGGERIRTPKSSPGRVPGSGKTPGIERVPGWDAYPWLRAGFSTRLHGASTIYSLGETGSDADNRRGELNLGWTRDDDPEAVARNRKRFVATIAAGSPSARHALQLAAIRQTHTPVVRLIEAGHGLLATADDHAVLRGDALMTALPNILLGVQTADCVPVLIADTRHRVVAAFHAGWRGTLARIVERGVGTMQMHFGSRTRDLVAAIGPAIGSCCYAVGEEVRFEFESQFAYANALFSEVYDSDPVRDKYPLLFLTARAPGHSNIGPQIHLDLHEANRRQLLDAGISPKKISVLGECTACTRLPNGWRKYFSHRGEHGFTGRMMSVIGIAGEK